MNGAGAPAPTFIKAVEYWVPNADRSVLEFGSGLYGPGSRMALISKAMCLGRGEGLPGLAWQQNAPVFLPDLGKGSGFLRGDSAVKVGINRGLALPCATPGRSQFVLALLSALGTPIARRLEIWRPNFDHTALILSTGFCETQGLLDGVGTRVGKGQGSVGRCWLTGLPLTSTRPASEPGDVGGLPHVSALAVLPVLPVLTEGRFVAAVALYF